MVCEKCWAEAQERTKLFGGSTSEHYEVILKERVDNPCSLKEQAGRFWSDGRGLDTRFYGGEK